MLALLLTLVALVATSDAGRSDGVGGASDCGAPTVDGSRCRCCVGSAHGADADGGLVALMRCQPQHPVAHATPIPLMADNSFHLVARGWCWLFRRAIQLLSTTGNPLKEGPVPILEFDFMRRIKPSSEVITGSVRQMGHRSFSASQRVKQSPQRSRWQGVKVILLPS